MTRAVTRVRNVTNVTNAVIHGLMFYARGHTHTRPPRCWPLFVVPVPKRQSISDNQITFIPDNLRTIRHLNVIENTKWAQCQSRSIWNICSYDEIFY